MRARAARRAIAGLVLGVFSVANPVARAEAPEPQGYRTGNYKASTPATSAGGTALDTSTARQLWKDGGAVWIDVLAAPHRPANLPASAVWLPVPRRDIPGSVWLPDVGRGELNANLEAYFRTNLVRITKGRRDTAVVFYCLANCCMSWNAANRSASWGYTRVYWYRDGTDGWEAAKLPLAAAAPVPGSQ